MVLIRFKQDPGPARWGTQALKTMGLCALLGFPALLAFGLGVVIWAYGLVVGTVCGCIGLIKDQDRTRAALALGLVVLVITAGYLNGQHH